MPEGYFFAPGFAHEIGHMFWGRVQSADGPIVSEGLAEVSMGLYLEKAFGERAFRAMLKNGAPELLLGHSARLYFRSIQSPLAGTVGAALGTRTRRIYPSASRSPTSATRSTRWPTAKAGSSSRCSAISSAGKRSGRASRRDVPLCGQSPDPWPDSRPSSRRLPAGI